MGIDIDVDMDIFQGSYYGLLFKTKNGLLWGIVVDCLAVQELPKKCGNLYEGQLGRL